MFMLVLSYLDPSFQPPSCRKDFLTACCLLLLLLLAAAVPTNTCCSALDPKRCCKTLTG